MYQKYVVRLLGRARKSKPRTHGIMLDKMSKSLGGLRMRISIAEEKRRPHDPVQAAKFTSEASVVVRREVPILMPWKQYKGERPGTVSSTRFVERINECMGIPS